MYGKALGWGHTQNVGPRLCPTFYECFHPWA
jgi:hypothetical protein